MPGDIPNFNRTRNLVYLIIGLPCLIILGFLAIWQGPDTDKPKTQSEKQKSTPRKQAISPGTETLPAPTAQSLSKGRTRIRLLRIGTAVQFPAASGKTAPTAVLELFYLVEYTGSEELKQRNQGPLSIYDKAGKEINRAAPRMNRSFAYSDFTPTWLIALPPVENKDKSFVQVQRISLPANTEIDSIVIREGFNGMYTDFRFAELALP